MIRAEKLPQYRDNAIRIVMGILIVIAGYLLAAKFGEVYPFEAAGDDLSVVSLTELPADFPVPAVGNVEYSGAGEQLRNKIVWVVPTSVEEASQPYRQMLESARWEVMLAEEDGEHYRVRVARIGDGGDMTHWGMLDVSPASGGSRISFEFLVTGGGIRIQ